MREDLAAMGQPLSENDFYAIILGSLPASYDPYISAVNATSSVLGKTISADNLMLTVTEEYERRNLKNKSGKKDENSAFYSNDSEKDGKGGSSLKSKKRMSNVITVTRRVIINLNVGHLVEENKAKDRSKKEKGRRRRKKRRTIRKSPGLLPKQKKRRMKKKRHG